MSRTSTVKYLYLAYFSRPAAERKLVRTVRRHKVQKIVELGVGDASRAIRLIAAAARQNDVGDVSYTGIDLFEARPSHAPGVTLKRAHRLLGATGAQISLVPGDPLSALSRVANSLVGTDLLIVGHDQDPDSLEQSWFFVPRLLHEHSIVLVEDRPTGPESERHYRPLPRTDIAQRATLASPRRAA